MHPLPLPLLDVEGEGQDQVEFDPLAKVLDDGVLPQAAALLVVPAGQVDAPPTQFVQGGLVGQDEVPLAHQLPYPLEQLALADLGHVQEQHAGIAVVPVDPVLADGVDAGGVFMAFYVRVEQRRDVLGAHGVDVEVEDLVGDAVELAQKQAQLRVGRVLVPPVLVAVGRLQIEVGQVVEGDAAVRVFAAQRRLQHAHLVFAEGQVARLLFAQIHRQHVDVERAVGVRGGGQRREQKPVEHRLVAGVAERDGCVCHRLASGYRAIRRSYSS